MSSISTGTGRRRPLGWKRDRRLRIAQWSLISVGVVLVGLWALGRLGGRFGSDAEIRRFEAARDARAGASVEATVSSAPGSTFEVDRPVDMSLWAEGRIEEYEESLRHDVGVPLALLRIPTIDLEVAVLEGTSELVLNRGVGHIEGTIVPGEVGNVGIAGHRDGFFRGLKDIGIGDVLELETLSDVATYRVFETFVVDPTDVHVLDPTDRPVITQVTCYPFYFVGSAPQRFIVRAERVGGHLTRR